MPLRLALVLVVLVAFAAPPRAQTAWVNGLVTDAETGDPVPGARVFVSGAAVAAETDGEGRFVFSTTAPRAAEIVAAREGYGAAATDRTLVPGETVPIAFRLRPAPPAEAAAEPDAEAFEVFREAFIGSSGNAEATYVVNPHALVLRLDDDRLQAAATAPLVVRNAALGYELTVYGFTLAAEDGLRVWDGHAVFRDLCAPSCGSAVAEAREVAYEGSLQHFLAAVAHDRLDDEGYRAGPVYEPYDGGSGLSINATRMTGSGYSVPDLERRRAGAGWAVETGGALRVSYKRERDPRLRYNAPQVSWLTAPDGVLHVGPDGGLLRAEGVVHYGYWDWVRVADLLPADYRPARDEG